MQIVISNIERISQGTRNYIIVHYNTNGKAEKKNVMPNNPTYQTFSTSKVGDTFEVQLGKNDKGFWEFKEATKAGEASNTAGSAGQSKTTSTSPSPRSTYETPEERAARQIYIIRQSSLSTAVNILMSGNKTVGLSDVLKTAKVLENYVVSKEEESFFDDMVEDIPTIE